MRRNFIIAIVWIALAMSGALLNTSLNDRLTTSLTIPNSESAKAQSLLTSHFADNPEGSFFLFYVFKNATPAELREMKSKVARAVASIPHAQINDSRALGGILFTQVGSSDDLATASLSTEKLRKALISAGLPGVLVTGPPAIKHDVTPVMADDLRRGELVALGVAALLLLFILGLSWATLIPLIFALINITATIAVIYLVSLVFTMVLYIPNIVALIGLGLAIDYSLLYIHRIRTELSEQKRFEDACSVAKETAGRTIRISALSVSIGLATLLFVPVPFIRSLGLAGLVVPLISALSAHTLLPVLIKIAGEHGMRPWKFSGVLHSREPLNNFFARCARISIRYPKAIAISSLGFIAILAFSIQSLVVTPSALTQLPSNLESARALALVTDSAGDGVITPHEIVIDLGTSNLARSENSQIALKAFVSSLSAIPEVFAVASDSTSAFIDASERYIRLFVVGQSEIGSAAANQLMENVRSAMSSNSFPSGTHLYLGGTPAQGADFLNALARTFPILIVAAVIAIFLALRRFLHSSVLSIKAILLDLLSLISTIGTLVFVTKYHVAHHIFGVYDFPRIEAWVIVFFIAILFGLSMDYEIFIVSRIREAWLKGRTNDEAIIEGIAHTGGVVTSAAFILIGAMSGFIWGHFVGLQQLGLGLALGILIDASIIRLFLLPSVMALLGKWNWQSKN
jgi:RND superfamily putative drug exporter